MNEEEKMIEDGTLIFDEDERFASVRSHEGGSLIVDFFWHGDVCRPFVGAIFNVQRAQKMIDMLSKFIDIELGEYCWSEIVGSRVVLKVTSKDGDMKYDYHDAIVVNHVVADDGTELVLLKFGDGTCIWTWVARHQQDEWLETSNRWLRVVNVDRSGDPHE